jgi:hypothetical protein
MQRVVQYDDPDYQMQLSHTASRFEVQHRGEEAIEIQGVLLYPDGARRTPGPFGASKEPPTAPYELWNLLVLYRQEVYTRLANAQRELGFALQAQAIKAYNEMSADSPNDYDIEKLRKLTVRVEKAKRSLKIAKQQFERHTPAHVKDAEKHSREIFAENMKFARRALAALDKLGFCNPNER